jgi:predicted house-cleaning noncanonical NTP pyrophosphatase (MazG superfamily)
MARRFGFNKLVRDKIPDLMRKKNINVFEYAMEKEGYIQELKRKLLEEAEEVISASSKADITEELADVLEVIFALANVYDITHDQIEHARCVKKESRGGFEEQIYVTHVEMSDDNRDVEYYRAQSDKYPEII